MDLRSRLKLAATKVAVQKCASRTYVLVDVSYSTTQPDRARCKHLLTTATEEEKTHIKANCDFDRDSNGNVKLDPLRGPMLEAKDRKYSRIETIKVALRQVAKHVFEQGSRLSVITFSSKAHSDFSRQQWAQFTKSRSSEIDQNVNTVLSLIKEPTGDTNFLDAVAHVAKLEKKAMNAEAGGVPYAKIIAKENEVYGPIPVTVIVLSDGVPQSAGKKQTIGMLLADPNLKYLAEERKANFEYVLMSSKNSLKIFHKPELIDAKFRANEQAFQDDKAFAGKFAEGLKGHKGFRVHLPETLSEDTLQMVLKNRKCVLPFPTVYFENASSKLFDYEADVKKFNQDYSKFWSIQGCPKDGEHVEFFISGYASARDSSDKNAALALKRGNQLACHLLRYQEARNKAYEAKGSKRKMCSRWTVNVGSFGDLKAVEDANADLDAQKKDRRATLYFFKNTVEDIGEFKGTVYDQAKLATMCKAFSEKSTYAGPHYPNY